MNVSGKQIDTAFLQAFNDAWNRHDIDALMAFMTDDCQFHAVAGPELFGRSFIGRDAVLRKKEAGLDRRMVQFRLSDPEVMVYHNEPILRDGRIVGHLTSGAYGHHLGAAIGMGYLPCKGEGAEALLASRYEIEIAGRRVAAEVSLKPIYDPEGARVRM